MHLHDNTYICLSSCACPQDTLEQVHSLSGFLDVDNLTTISKAELKECVKASCCLVLFACDEALQSEWVCLELATAKRQHIDIIPLIDQDRFVERDLIMLYMENEMEFVFAQQSVPYRCAAFTGIMRTAFC